MKNLVTPKKADAKKAERFQVVTRVKSSSPLFMLSEIKWKQNPEPLLLTVSRASGSSVMRNRWKRLMKEWFYSEGLKTIPGQNIWIRFNRTKTLKKPLIYKEWAAMLNAEATKIRSASQL